MKLSERIFEWILSIVVAGLYSYINYDLISELDGFFDLFLYVMPVMLVVTGGIVGLFIYLFKDGLKSVCRSIIWLIFSYFSVAVISGFLYHICDLNNSLIIYMIDFVLFLIYERLYFGMNYNRPNIGLIRCIQFAYYIRTGQVDKFDAMAKERYSKCPRRADGTLPCYPEGICKFCSKGFASSNPLVSRILYRVAYGRWK